MQCHIPGQTPCCHQQHRLATKPGHDAGRKQGSLAPAGAIARRDGLLWASSLLQLGSPQSQLCNPTAGQLDDSLPFHDTMHASPDGAWQDKTRQDNYNCPSQFRLTSCVPKQGSVQELGHFCACNACCAACALVKSLICLIVCGADSIDRGHRQLQRRQPDANPAGQANPGSQLCL